MAKDTNNVMDYQAEDGESFHCQRYFNRNNKKGTPNEVGKSTIGTLQK